MTAKVKIVSGNKSNIEERTNEALKGIGDKKVLDIDIKMSAGESVTTAIVFED